MRNIFLEISYTKCGGESSPKLFSEKLKLSVSLNQQSKRLKQSVFIVCQIEGYRNILRLSCRPLAFTSQQAFLKNKKRSSTSLPCLIFCIIFKEKFFSGCILLIDQVLLFVYFYFMRDWIICVLQLFVNQDVTS